LPKRGGGEGRYAPAAERGGGDTNQINCRWEEFYLGKEEKTTSFSQLGDEERGRREKAWFAADAKKKKVPMFAMAREIRGLLTQWKGKKKGIK